MVFDGVEVADESVVVEFGAAEAGDDVPVVPVEVLADPANGDGVGGGEDGFDVQFVHRRRPFEGERRPARGRRAAGRDRVVRVTGRAKPTSSVRIMGRGRWERAGNVGVLGAEGSGVRASDR